MTETHSQNRRLGYARVSTYGQTLDAQLEQLRGAGCSKIYREKVTGAHSDRRELLKMLYALAPGDVVTVTRIDRLARSTFDLFAIVKQIVDAKAQFRSLAEPWADTGTSTGRLMLAVLGGLADVERDLIRTRTAEGRSRAKAQYTLTHNMDCKKDVFQTLVSLMITARAADNEKSCPSGYWIIERSSFTSNEMVISSMDPNVKVCIVDSEFRENTKVIEIKPH